LLLLWLRRRFVRRSNGRQVTVSGESFVVGRLRPGPRPTTHQAVLSTCKRLYYPQ
jgi:hypothetical protein